MKRKGDGMMESYRRLRHTYGFGVHSPFAYSLVTDVVRPGRGYAFYGYEDIDATFGSRVLPGVRREARMLLRLAAFIRPREVFLPSGIHPAYHAALHAAGVREIVRRPRLAGSCDMICTRGDFLSERILREMLARPGSVVAVRDIPSAWAQRLFLSIGEGLMLLGRRNAVLIHRTGMQPLCYTMRI